MEKFVRLSAKACPLALPNLNTDQFCRRAISNGRARKASAQFYSKTCVAMRTAMSAPTFRSTNRPGATPRYLVAGRNFGGGSSREAAVYALYDAGIKCVIASSFGDIFAQNAVKNGLLTAILPEADAAELAAAIAADPEQPVSVDLERQTISRGNRICPLPSIRSAAIS